jgi:P27 family predicted phage terminase small subunit
VARPREPVDLIIAKGRKHLTQDEIRERKRNEVSAPSDKVKAPDYLTPELKREFTKIAKQLMAIGIMTNLHVDALARFVIARSMYVTLSMQIINQPAILMSDKYPQIAINQDKAFKQCSSAARDLGLTISSRCKLVLPETAEREKSPMAEFLEKRRLNQTQRDKDA